MHIANVPSCIEYHFNLSVKQQPTSISSVLSKTQLFRYVNISVTFHVALEHDILFIVSLETVAKSRKK